MGLRYGDLGGIFCIVKPSCVNACCFRFSRCLGQVVIHYKYLQRFLVFPLFCRLLSLPLTTRDTLDGDILVVVLQDCISFSCVERSEDRVVLLLPVHSYSLHLDYWGCTIYCHKNRI